MYVHTFQIYIAKRHRVFVDICIAYSHSLVDICIRRLLVGKEAIKLGLGCTIYNLNVLFRMAPTNFFIAGSNGRNQGASFDQLLALQLAHDRTQPIRALRVKRNAVIYVHIARIFFFQGAL